MVPAVRRAIFHGVAVLGVLTASSLPVQVQKAPSYYGPQPATENIDLTMYARIRDEGFKHSHVMEFGAALIEWPERAEDRLPADALSVHLLADSERRAVLEGPQRWRSLEAAHV